MNKLNEIIKKILLIFFIIFSHQLYAETYKKWSLNIEYNGLSEQQQKKTGTLIFQNIIKPYAEYSDKNLNLLIKINLVEKNNKDSFSEESNNLCKITINYNPNKSKFFKDKSKDFSFIFLHELSHCLLGYDKLYEKINWVIPITDLNKVILDDHFNLLEDLSIHRYEELDSINTIQSGAPIPHPMIVYHEMFADIQALDFLITKKSDINLAKKLKKIREKHFQKYLISSPYASNFAIPKFIDFFDKKVDNSNLEKNNFIVQLGFIKYVQKIYSTYNLRKKND